LLLFVKLLACQQVAFSLIKEMKLALLFLAVLGCSFCFITQAEEPIRFHLDLNHPPPKPRDEFERTTRVFLSIWNTNIMDGRVSVTNRFHFSEFVAREKILNWDENGDWSKVNLTVERFVDGDGERTNELLKPGSQLIGTAIAGEIFFQPKSGILTEKVYRELKVSCNIRPHEFDISTKTPKSLSIGETWKPEFQTNSKAANLFGLPLIKNSKFTGQLVETTNLFGFDCFHMQYQIGFNGTPEFLQQAAEISFASAPVIENKTTVDLFAPFDTSQRMLTGMLLANLFVDSLMSSKNIDKGANSVSSYRRTTTKIVFEFRPLLHQ
jgi:hypothetical protein